MVKSLTDQQQLELVNGLKGSELEKLVLDDNGAIKQALPETLSLPKLPEQLSLNAMSEERVREKKIEDQEEMPVGVSEETTAEFIRSLDEMEEKKKKIRDDILKREIWVYKLDDAGNKTEKKEWIQLKSFVPEHAVLIVEDKRGRGHVEYNGILLDEAVDLIEKRVGAKIVKDEMRVNGILSRQEVRDRFVLTNEYPHYVIKIEIEFDDESTNVGTGEANPDNCTTFIARKNMYIMAEKRARHRAVLRSERVRLRDLYSEIEAEEFRETVSLRDRLKKVEQNMDREIRESRSETAKYKRELTKSNQEVVSLKQELLQLNKELGKKEYGWQVASDYANAVTSVIVKLEEGVQQQILGMLDEPNRQLFEKVVQKLQNSKAE